VALVTAIEAAVDSGTGPTNARYPPAAGTLPERAGRRG